MPVSTSVKNLVELLGAPHTEVDLILVNGVSVDFSYIPRSGDHIHVYPVFELFDISPLIRLRPEPLRQTCFIADTHLGKLAGYLRMLGFDTLYNCNFQDEEIALIASQEQRIVLTRDRGILKRNLVTRGIYVHAIQPRQQLKEILQRLQLVDLLRPFQRCMECNQILENVDKQNVLALLSPRTVEFYNEFQQCPACKRVYWKGTHYQNMKKLIEEVTG